VWGKDWIQAKTQAESYDYLFQVSECGSRWLHVHTHLLVAHAMWLGQ
jgi:FtsP/CotA-like multicopper oxidase with cupredoxin domain